MKYVARKQLSEKQLSSWVMFKMISSQVQATNDCSRSVWTAVRGCCIEYGCYSGDEDREYFSIQGFIRATTRSPIGPDNVVIQCNWLLIGHNAPISSLLIMFDEAALQ